MTFTISPELDAAVERVIELELAAAQAEIDDYLSGILQGLLTRDQLAKLERVAASQGRKVIAISVLTEERDTDEQDQRNIANLHGGDL